MFGDILNQAQSIGGDLKGRWDNWIAQPANKAFMVQMGLGMLQPVNPGQSTIGHLAQAAGTGFQAKQRVEKQSQAEADKTYARQQAELDRQNEETDRAFKRGILGRQATVAERNADSMADYRKRGASLNSLFANQNRDQDRYENFIIRQAQAAATADASNIDPDYVPKTATDYMNDPAWLQAQQQAYAALPQLPAQNPVQSPSLPVPSSVPNGAPQMQAQPIPKPTGATPQYTEGQIVNTPSGRYKAVTVNGQKTWQKVP